jgi:hypothetical protein
MAIFALLIFIIFAAGLIFVFKRLQNKPEIQEKERLALISMNYAIPNLLICDMEKKPYQLSNLLNCNAKVILNVSNCKCYDCIDHVLFYLKKHAKMIGRDNIIVLCDFSTNNEFLYFMRDYDIDLNIFSTYGNSVGIPVESLHLPYFLVLDSTLRSIDVFVPSKNSPKRTDLFLERTIQTFF